MTVTGVRLETLIGPDDAPDVITLLRQHIRLRPTATAVTAVVDPDEPENTRSWTFAELDRRAGEVAAELAARVPVGDRVLVLCTDVTGMAAAFLGSLYAGVIAATAPLPGNRQQRARLTGIARDAGVSAVVCDRRDHVAVSAWIGEAGLGPLPVLAVEDLDGTEVSPAPAPAVTPPDRATPALLQYTSGSTAEPKGVVVTHGNLLHNAASVGSRFGLDESTPFGGWIPLYHDMGLIGLLVLPLLLGTSSTMMTPSAFLRRPVRWLRLIDRHGIALSAAPNFGYELCLRQVTDAQLVGLDLSRWRVGVNGSEPVRASTLDAFADRFAATGLRRDVLTPCFGMAEATVLVSGTNPRTPVVHRVSADALQRGRFEPASGDVPVRTVVSCGGAPDFDVRIVDPRSREVLPEGLVGEVWLAGESVAVGYWRADEASAATFGARTADGTGPYLRTGDLGTFVGGELVVTGRLKDMLIVRGRNLHPQDLEHAVAGAYPELAKLAGAVFAVPAGADEDEAVVVAHEAPGHLPRERLAWLATSIRQSIVTEFGVAAEHVVLVRPGNVLRTTSGKVRRSAMRDAFLAGALDPLHLDSVVRGPDPEALRAWLVARIAAEVRLPAHRVRPDEPFASYGLDSVAAVMICADVEDEFGIVVDPGQMWTHPTVDALVAALTGGPR